MPDDQIIVVHNSSVSKHILKQTEGHGIDVILSHPDGERKEDYSQCLALFGRSVRVSRNDISLQSVDTKSLSPNHSLGSFDLESLARHKPNIIQE